MYYTQIPYNNPLVQTCDKILRATTNPSARLFWRNNNKTIHKIIGMLGYFTNKHILIREFNLTRSDSIHAVLRNEQYWANRTLEFENCYGIGDENFAYLNLHTVYVKGQVIDTFENTAPEYYRNSGYKELTGCSLALKTSPRHRVRVYHKTTHKHISETEYRTINSVVILTANDLFDYNNDALLYRKIIALIPFFCDINNVDPNAEETQWFTTIENHSDAATYLTFIESVLKTIPAFNDFQITETLSILKNLNEVQKLQLKDILDRATARVMDCEKALTDSLKQQRDAANEYAGLSDTCLTTDELKMLINKQIVIQPRINGNDFNYLCKAPCLSFDKNAAINYYNRTLLKEYPNSVFTKLFKLAFIDEVIIFMFEDSIKLNFRDITIYGKYELATTEIGLRNPHHYYYNCWGSYDPIIKKLLQSYSYLQAFLQIKAAVGSLNMLDYTVLAKFRGQILNRYNVESYNSIQYAPCIVWKEEQDMNKLHTLHETLNKFSEVETDETN